MMGWELQISVDCLGFDTVSFCPHWTILKISLKTDRPRMLFLLRHVEHDFYMKLRLLTTFSACCIGLIVLARLFLFERLVGFFSSVSCRAESPPRWSISEVPSFTNCCSSLLSSKLYGEQVFLGKNSNCMVMSSSCIFMLLQLGWEAGGAASKDVVKKSEILGWVAVPELMGLPDKLMLNQPDISCLLSEMGGTLLSWSLWVCT